jgi:serine/threonine-protein kinase SRPK3
VTTDDSLVVSRVQIGEVYNNRYTVTKKLGWGHFSTVWLCHDALTGERVALKVQKSAEHYTGACERVALLSACCSFIDLETCTRTEAAFDEIEILNVVAAQERAFGHDAKVVRIIDSFFHAGPHGKRTLCPQSVKRFPPSCP